MFAKAESYNWNTERLKRFPTLRKRNRLIEKQRLSEEKN